MSQIQVEEPVMEQQTPTEPPLVRGHDRCDRCGGEAFVKTRHPLGRHATDEVTTADLLWCKHHFEKYPKLTEFVVLDERERLTTPVVSSY